MPAQAILSDRAEVSVKAEVQSLEQELAKEYLTQFVTPMIWKF
jgi:hypothetical protein